MLDTLTKPASVDMKSRQAPLREGYVRMPTTAQITDHATTRSDRIQPDQPIYTEIEFGDANRTRLPIALHKGVGGNSDLPVPGELLCAAIASCLDSTIRVISNMFGLAIETLEVHAEAEVDLRGTLRMDPNVPTAFQKISVSVNLVPRDEVPKEHLDAIVSAAEQSCVVLQSLRTPPQIDVERC
ncbi:MAG: OsmC family protein [Henriciella sp.]|nr:OsmC family protein [Henriciella sp.]